MSGGHDGSETPTDISELEGELRSRDGSGSRGKPGVGRVAGRRDSREVPE